MHASRNPDPLAHAQTVPDEERTARAPSPLSIWDRLFPSPMAHPDIIRVGFMQGNTLHNFLVVLYHLARIPISLCALLVAMMLVPSVLVFEDRLSASLVMGSAALLDLGLLWLLPRLGISYGWVQPPWLMYTAGRSLLALLLGLLPWSDSLAIAVLVGVQLTLTGLSLYGSLVEPFRIRHTRLTFAVPGLGARLRLLLLTDLHMERPTARERRLPELIRREAPDAILLGGDLFNLSYVGDPETLEHTRDLLARLEAPAGVYFVRGTLDVDPPALVERVMQGLDIRVLENETVLLRRGQAAIHLVGVPAARDPEERERELVRLLARAPRPVICLHHTPDLLDVAARNGATLYLAGHTHGGQICLPLLGPIATGSRLGRRYVAGAYTVDRTRAYVSRGLGLEGLGAPRMRFLAPPELVWITLEPPTDEPAR